MDKKEVAQVMILIYCIIFFAVVMALLVMMFDRQTDYIDGFAQVTSLYWSVS